MIIKLYDITGFRPKADGSVSLGINTAFEQSPKDKAELLSIHGKRCMVAIKPEESPFLDSELKDMDSVDMDLEDTSKTPSKRLRNVLFRLWEQKPEGEFKDFYKSRMERLISLIKEKLD